MSRINEIDSFLRKLSQLAKSSNYGIDEDIVYEALKRYGFTNEEYKNGFAISQYFDYWIDYFKNKNNIGVFVHPIQKNFLQFWNERDFDTEYIKLYVSVDANSMLKSVNEIFTELEKMNAVQGSKVAPRVRSDSIVLRIKNEKDVKEIIEFINNNKTIKNGSKKTNPFMLREGIVGLAYDDNLSYNSAVSFLISEYIKQKKENQGLENVNCIDFSNYVASFSRCLVTSKDFLKKFMKTAYYKQNSDRIEYYGQSDVLSNIKRVFDLIDFNLNDNNTYEDFITMYKNSKEEKEELMNDFNKLLIDTHELFINSCRETYQKYGTRQLAGAIDKAINGDYSSFTNDNNLRETMKKYMGKEEIKKIVDGLIFSSEAVFRKSEGYTCARIIENMYKEETNSKSK